MAISTPAQNPLGSASSTLSTRTRARLRPPARILAPCRCPGWRPSTPAVRPLWPVCSPGTRSSRSTARSPATSSSTSLLVDEAEVDLELRRGGPGGRPGRSASRPASRWGSRSSLGPLRPGPHLRQPLRVLLHLPAAQGHAAQPLPEGRRLPAVVPLRQLHHPDPLHRGRPRAGGDRTPEPAVRLHPCHRSRGPGPTVAQPAGGDQPAVAAGPARRGHRGPRPDRGLPGASTTGRSSTTPWPGCSTGTRSWPRWPWCRSGSVGSPPNRPCGPTPRPRPPRSCDPSRVAGHVPRHVWADGWCSPPTSTT